MELLSGELLWIPRITLQDRHLGKVVHGVKPGPKSYLTGNEESELGQFIEVIAMERLKNKSRPSLNLLLVRRGFSDVHSRISDGCLSIDHLVYLPRKVSEKSGTVLQAIKVKLQVIGCVSAAGQAIPPFVIYDSKSLNIEWTRGEVAETTYGLSD